MNLSHLSDHELLAYLDLHSTDPIVQRLVRMLVACDGGIMNGLVDAGMNPSTWVFTDDHMEYDPGDYIEHLQKSVAYAEDELVVAGMDLADARNEVERLSTRSVTELLVDAQRAIGNVEALHRHAQRQTEKAHEVIDQVRAENRHLKEQLGMWTILETE